MRPIGYLYKHVATRPKSLKPSQVRDIYSLSACVSDDFADYVRYWKHNGFWLFDSPSVIQRLAAEHSIALEGAKLFYYEAYELQYDEDRRSWLGFEPEPSIETNVVTSTSRVLEGFDVVTFASGTSPECSPLSCNALANKLSVNEHCLFRTFDQAKRALEDGEFNECEPGPYRIVAVYSVNDT